MRDFFKSYSRLPQFKNTIFIITGDHNIRALPFVHELDPYHVPLIIWSPLMTRSKLIKSVNSHIDISPSILSLLSANFKLNTLQTNPFIGKNLDTSEKFYSKKVFPLKLYSNAYPSFVYKNMIKTPIGFKLIFEGFKSTKLNNDKLEPMLDSIYNNYSVLDNYIVRKNKICK
jgi:lipoteichoic acid synthase